MQTVSRGRNRGKSYSYRNNYEENNSTENGPRNSFRDREVPHNQDELDESRTVMLLPDANMTISVANNFRGASNTRSKSNRGILKSTSFHEDTNLNANNERLNNQYFSHGFETINNNRGGRGRGRGFHRGYNNREYTKDSHQQDTIRHNRPSSGTFDYDNNQYYYYSYNNYPHNPHNQRDEHYGAQNRDRQSYNNDDGCQLDDPFKSRNFRGRSKSANDRQRRGGGRGMRRGRGGAKNKEDEVLIGDADKDKESAGDNDKLQEPFWLDHEDYPQQQQQAGEQSVGEVPENSDSVDKEEKDTGESDIPEEKCTLGEEVVKDIKKEEEEENTPERTADV